MGDFKHLSVHQWVRSAIFAPHQLTSPIGFPFLKLPPPPCAVLLVPIIVVIYGYMIWWDCNILYVYIYIYMDLVGGFSPPLWKMMGWKSVGVMTFPTEWKVIKLMFQTTNQLMVDHCWTMMISTMIDGKQQWLLAKWTMSSYLNGSHSMLDGRSSIHVDKTCISNGHQFFFEWES